MDPVGPVDPRAAQAPSPAPGTGPQPAGWGAAPEPAPAPQAATSLTIALVRRDGSEGESREVTAEPFHIGRTDGQMRFSDDSFVSPRHCRLQVADGKLYVTDLESRNGVYVRLSGSEPVYPGDHFLLGNRLLRLDNVPAQGSEEVDADGVRGFGTPLDPAWGRLVLIGVGNQAADSYDLRGSQVVFGRESGDVLFPRDSFLSRQHARLRMELRGGSMSVVLEDLDSANGTYLRMRGQAALEPGSMFRVGDQIFRVKES